MASEDWHIRRLVKQLADQERRLGALERSPQAGRSSIEAGGRLDEYDAEGNLVSRTGSQDDGTHGAAYLAGPIPPAPTAPILTHMPGFFTAWWDGTHADGAVTPLDFATVEVYVAAEDFTYIEDAVLVAVMAGEDGSRAVVAREPGTWHVGLVAVSKANRRSPVSERATVQVTASAAAEVVEAAWQAAQDAIDQARQAGAVANGKGRNIYGPTEADIAQYEPFSEHDQWFPGDGSIQRREGDAWVPVLLGAEALDDGSIITDKLAEAAVTVGKLAANSVTSASIAPGAVGSAEIADFAISVKKLNTNRHLIF